MKFDRYKMNLTRRGDEIYSYDTHVATIDHKKGTLHQLGWWSVTTQRHVNYVAKELNLELIDNRRIREIKNTNRDL